MTLSVITLYCRQTLLRCLAAIRRYLRIRRGERIMNWIYPPLARVKWPIQATVRYYWGFSLTVSTSSYLEWKIYINGCYEPHLVQLFRRLVREGSTVVDVGANIGVHTLILAALAGPQGNVIAVEPVPLVNRKLRHHLELNRIANVTVCEVALSDKQGTAQFFVEDDAINQGLGSLWRQPYHSQARAMEVQSTTLDSLVMDQSLTRVDLVKLDIQGGEYPALIGGLRALQRWKPYIVFEYDESWKQSGFGFDDLLGFLGKLGYQVHAIRESDSRLEVVEGDSPKKHSEFLAVHSERAIPG